MILVTGASGFIGRSLIPYLSKKGLNATPLYRSDKAEIQNDVWKADLRRHEHIKELLTANIIPHTVIHLAGYVDIAIKPNISNPQKLPIPGVQNIPLLYMENVIATANLLDFCLQTGVKHLIFASSQTVYGIPDTNIITEESPCMPIEHYANSKLCCEKLLQIGVKQGISITSLRFPGVYSKERKKGVVYNFCKSAIIDKQIIINTDLPLGIDVIYIDDVVDSFYKAYKHQGDQWLCFNIATGEPCSLNLLADSIAEMIDGCHVEYGTFPQPVIQMDSSKAQTVLGWKSLPRKKRLELIINTIQNDR